MLVSVVAKPVPGCQGARRAASFCDGEGDSIKSKAVKASASCGVTSDSNVTCKEPEESYPNGQLVP
jgi:hypothetical protein